MIRIVALAISVISLTSCATANVMLELEGGERLEINEYVSDVKKASMSPDTGKHYVCLEITSLESKEKRLVTMIAPPDKHRDSDIDGNDGSRYIKVKLKDEPVEGCELPGEELPVIFIKNHHNMSDVFKEFDLNQMSAVYALETQYPGVKRMIANVGHLNRKKGTDTYEFRQFLYNHELYEKKMVEGNPWMLALLPVAVAADIVMTFFLKGHYHGNGVEDKSKLWKSDMPNQPVEQDRFVLEKWEESD